jgi:hypothetical protein
MVPNDERIFVRRVDAQLRWEDATVGILDSVIGILGSKTSGAWSSSRPVQQIDAMLASTASGGDWVD